MNHRQENVDLASARRECVAGLRQDDRGRPQHGLRDREERQDQSVRYGSRILIPMSAIEEFLSAEAELSGRGMRPPASWQDIDWNIATAELPGIDRKMTRLLEAGEHAKARAFRWVIFNSLAARVKAVKHAAQENKGRHTPGVDGEPTSTMNRSWNLS